MAADEQAKALVPDEFDVPRQLDSPVRRTLPRARHRARGLGPQRTRSTGLPGGGADRLGPLGGRSPSGSPTRFSGRAAMPGW